jgi:hypothetical protein
MALSKDIIIEVGSKQVDFPAAYGKVTEYHGDKESMTFVLSWSEAAGQPMIRQSTYRCPVDLDGENPIRQAYIHLKTLSEFSGASDC